MNILVIGTAHASECRQKFGEDHRWDVCENVSEAADRLTTSEVVFDFASAGDPSQLNQYVSGTRCPVFVDTSCVQLATLSKQTSLDRKHLFGFCGLPTLLNREVLEVSLLSQSDQQELASVCARLGTSYEVVADHAGMVSPRVICMIINEAFFTLEEGTATREDIDLAMKLGTNYPFGPFEWADRIGLSAVVNVLKGSLDETGDERYRVCPLLLKQLRVA